MLSVLAVCSFMAFTAPTSYGSDDPFSSWLDFSRSAEAQQMMGWMQCCLAEYVTGTRCMQGPDFRTPSFYGRFGLFVTLVKGGKVRGCFGAFDHRSDRIESLLRDYLKGALRRDNRYKPLEPSEAGDVRIIITVAGAQHQVEELESLDTARFGIVLMYENGERAVYVPSEIKSIDALKRGLKGREISQINAFRAVTIRQAKGR